MGANGTSISTGTDGTPSRKRVDTSTEIRGRAVAGAEDRRPGSDAVAHANELTASIPFFLSPDNRGAAVPMVACVVPV